MRLNSETPKRRLNILKIVFFAAFVIGIITANLFCKEKLNQYGIIHMFFLEQYEYHTLDHLDLMGYIVRIRVPVLLFLAIMGGSPPGWLLHLLYIFWNGFAYGFLCVAAISSLGAKAVLLMLAFLFPHYLFYVPGYVAMVTTQLRIAAEGGVNGMGLHYGKKKILFLLLIGMFGLTFFVGIWLESFVNPYIIQKILKIF